MSLRFRMWMPLAAVIGTGLMLLSTGLLSRRVERLTAGARLDVILGNLTEGVLAVDPEGWVTFANPAARSVLGAGNQMVLEELPDPWEEFDLPKAVARCGRERERFRARVGSGGVVLEVELQPLAGSDGRGAGVLVVVRDLSEGQRLEENQQRFLADAAHELSTPITTIAGAAQLLLAGDDGDPEVRRRFLKRILSEAERMERLSDTLLRLARTGADARGPDARPVDLHGAAREAAERMEPLAEKAGLALLVEGQGSVVLADREWLEQALLILLGNAIRHSGREGSVRLGVDAATITVQDEGVGISEDTLPHVFERFYKAKGGGFGLGLPICKDLMERMGGEVSIRSRQRVGTAVKIELPEASAGDARNPRNRG